MQQQKVKSLVTADRVVDGQRQFNPSKPHGVVYADGFFEAKYVQEYEGREVYYRGDGSPIGVDPGKVTPVADLARENAELKRALAEALAHQAPPPAQSEGAAGARKK